MAGIKVDSALVTLAFAGSVGMTLVILACALPKFNGVWWPIMVVLPYLLTPLPTLMARQYSQRNGSSNCIMDLAIFITMMFVVSAFAFPIVLARAPVADPVIQWPACYLTLAGNIVVFLTIVVFETLTQDDSEYIVW